MIPLIKAEFRKLFTIRSTYLLLFLAFALEVVVAFYAKAWHPDLKALQLPTYLSDQVFIVVNVLTLFCAIIAVLSITQEYRYGTIMYSLTSAKTRTRVLLAKVFVISVFAIVFVLFFGWLSPLLTSLGLHIRGVHIGPQHFDVWNLTWRAVLGGWGFVMLASILAFLIRIQVGAMAATFLIPGTVEGLLGLLLKNNQVYLPFSSLNVLLDSGPTHQITVAHAAMVASSYIVVGWLATWYFFIKRDAN